MSAALLFIAVALITRLVRQPALRAALPFIAAIGCILTGQTAAERVVLLVLFVTLLVPQSNGVNLFVSLIETGIAGIFAIIILIADLSSVSDATELADEFGVTYSQPLDMGNDSMWDVYLLYALTAIILIVIAISAVSTLIKLVRYLFKRLYAL